MMTVVLIVGILSVLATIAYKRWVRSAHVSEGTNMLIGIAQHQDHYYEETKSSGNPQYMDVSASLTDADAYPLPLQCGMSGTPCSTAPRKVGWGQACGSHCNTDASGAAIDWVKLDVQPDGPVAFNFLTRAGDGAVHGPADRAVPDFGPAYAGYQTQLNAVWAQNQSPWFVSIARADFDSNGTPVEITGNSFSNEILVNNEGE
jgi:hypothetical protein